MILSWSRENGIFYAFRATRGQSPPPAVILLLALLLLLRPASSVQRPACVACPCGRVAVMVPNSSDILNGRGSSRRDEHLVRRCSGLRRAEPVTHNDDIVTSESLEN